MWCAGIGQHEIDTDCVYEKGQRVSYDKADKSGLGSIARLAYHRSKCAVFYLGKYYALQLHSRDRNPKSES